MQFRYLGLVKVHRDLGKPAEYAGDIVAVEAYKPFLTLFSGSSIVVKRGSQHALESTKEAAEAHVAEMKGSHFETRSEPANAEAKKAASGDYIYIHRMPNLTLNDELTEVVAVVICKKAIESEEVIIVPDTKEQKTINPHYNLFRNIAKAVTYAELPPESKDKPAMTTEAKLKFLADELHNFAAYPDKYLRSPDADFYDKIARIRSQIADVKDIMMSNIDKVLERGERIESLLDKSVILLDSSVKFNKGAAKMNSCWGMGCSVG